MNYAIVPINIKQREDNLFIRCVLIEYKEMSNNVYYDTRIVEQCPYFKNDQGSLHYKFEDDGYTLLEDDETYLYPIPVFKRSYHICAGASIIDKRLLGDRFTCDSDEEAINLFVNGELYDTDSKPLKMGKKEG